MFCPNCGSQLPDDVAFCSNCGTKVQQNETVQAPIVEEPATTQPYTEPVSAPINDPQPAANVVAPADYTTVNIILLVVSILSCCSCISIASIVTSIIGITAGSACKKAIAAGDWATAEAKSKTAKTMWIVSAVIIGVSILLSLILTVTGALAGVAEMNW